MSAGEDCSSNDKDSLYEEDEPLDDEKIVPNLPKVIAWGTEESIMHKQMSLFDDNLLESSADSLPLLLEKERRVHAQPHFH